MSVSANYRYNIERLSKINDYAVVWQDPFFQKHFVKKYAWDLPRASFELFNVELSYQQIDIWKEYIDCGGWAGARVAFPSGHGCHAKNTPILMYDKSKKLIQDIKVGDLVMGDDRTPRRVWKLWRGREQMVKFVFGNGVERIYNLSHKLVIFNKFKEKTIVTVDEFLKRKWERPLIGVRDEKDLWLFDIVEIELLEEADYYGIGVSGNHLYLDGDYIITSNSGKTKFIGIITTLHLLCFFKSLTRIQAPKLEQVKKYSFKEINTSLDALASGRKLNGKYFKSEWAFLNKFIQRNKEQIYIKGHQTTWYIEAVTAPKGDSTNLSGQHQLNYLLVLDEASGIEDTHIEASMGALTEKYNSCIMFSQHTKLRGKFHDAVTIHSKANGGLWGGFRLSSRQSPRVSREQLKIMLETYTDEEVRVRIDGLPPTHETGMLIAQEEALSLYNNKREVFNKEDKFDQLIISYDIGYSGYRDSSVAIFVECAGIKDLTLDKEMVFYKTKLLKEFTGTNGKLPVEFTTKNLFPLILDYLSNSDKIYSTIYVIGDATAGGYEAYTELEKMLLELDYNFECKGLQWGVEKLYFEDKKRFINARAKGYVNLKTALTNKRMKSEIKIKESKVISQLTQIPYKWTSTLKYQIVSKEEMAKMGIPSPDIGDCYAQLFLVNVLITNFINEDISKLDEDNGYSLKDLEELTINEDNEEREAKEFIDETQDPLLVTLLQ